MLNVSQTNKKMIIFCVALERNLETQRSESRAVMAGGGEVAGAGGKQFWEQK